MVRLTGKASRKLKVKIISALIAYVVFIIILSSTPTVICGTIEFRLEGVESDATGIILTLGDGTSYSWAQFDFLKYEPANTTLTFVWNSPISAGSTKRYIWDYAFGISYDQSGYITFPSYDYYFTSSYKPQYYVTIGAGVGGTVDRTSGWFDPYPYGGDYSITATPNIGGRFIQWTQSGYIVVVDPSNPTTTFLVSGAGTLQAIFESPQISFDAMGVLGDFEGLILVVDGQEIHSNDFTKTYFWAPGSVHSFAWQSPLTVSAEKRYVWSSTSGLTTLQTGSITSPSGSALVRGTYSTEYYVTIHNTTGGMTNPITGGWYKSDETIGISATPSASYLFSNWITTGGVAIASPTSSPTTFTVYGSGTIAANFTSIPPNTFVVTVQSSEGGSTNPSGSNVYLQGASIEITATPSSGYQFTGWSVTGNATVADPTSPSTTLIANGPCTVTANFQLSGGGDGGGGEGGVPPEVVAIVAVVVVAIIGLGFYLANNPAGQEILKNIWEIRKNIRTPRKKEPKKEAERAPITESPLTFALSLEGSTIVQGEGTGQLYEDKIVILLQTGKSLSFPLQMISEIRAKDYIIVIIFIAGEILTLSKLGQRYDDFVNTLARLRK